jgi:hypothetical protein
VARTVWLAAFCLLGLGPFVLMKVVTGTSARPVAADIVGAARPSVTASLPEDTLGKSDRLPEFHPTEVKQEEATVTPAVAPMEAVQPSVQDDPPKIVPRHWHEGDTIRGAKRKLTRRSTGKRSDTTIASNARANGRSN